jgi:hypothetical protein
MRLPTVAQRDCARTYEKIRMPPLSVCCGRRSTRRAVLSAMAAGQKMHGTEASKESIGMVLSGGSWVGVFGPV